MMRILWLVVPEMPSSLDELKATLYRGSLLDSMRS